MHHTTATGGVADIAIQNAWIGSSLSYNNYGEALLAGIVWRWIEEKKKYWKTAAWMTTHVLHTFNETDITNKVLKAT